MTTTLTRAEAGDAVFARADPATGRALDDREFFQRTGVDPEDVPRIVRQLYDLYIAGRTVAEAAAELGITARRASLLFVECGLPLRRAGLPRDVVPWGESVTERCRREARERAEQRARERARDAARHEAERERRRQERRRLVLERVNQMYAVYESGATLREVGERFGISESRVGQLFGWAGLPRRKARRRPRPAAEGREAALNRVGDVHASYRAGATLDEVGQRMGLTGARVWQLFREAGLPTRSRGGGGQEGGGDD